MQNHIVIGLGYGDEGKGLVTSSLAASLPNSVVVRFNGGHQAGHTVVTNGKRHVFSNFGSGTLHGVPTVWTKYCTFDPAAVVLEYKALLDLGVEPKLYVDLDCPVVTPYDIMANVSSSTDRDNGTCGVGFGQTLRREGAGYKLHVRDLFYPKVLRNKLHLIKGRYYQHDGNYSDIADMLDSVDDLLNLDIIKPFTGEIYDYDNIIFEGAQGIMLDIDHGFFPHVTRSNTTSKNAREFINSYELTEDGPNEMYYVTRTYQTRHGNGPMTNENMSVLKLRNNENETNVENMQGDFRITPLDTEMLRYALACDKHHFDNIKLAVTCTDQLDNPTPLEIAHDLGLMKEDLLIFDSPVTKKLYLDE